MTADLPVAATARRLAAAFERDEQLAVAQQDALDRVRAANGELWSGLHPDAVGLLYDDTHAVEIRDQGRVRSHITAVITDARHAGAADEQVQTIVLQAVQQIHWTIHRAVADLQRASEDRRQLAADVGELTGALIAALAKTGWSEQQARQADVRALAGDALRAQEAAEDADRATRRCRHGDARR